MRIFISYSMKDRAFAGRLARELKAAGHTVWSDSEILPGDNWASARGKALDDADALVAIVSPDAVKSGHLRSEWEYALGQERFANRLIPVVVRKTADMPWILKRLPQTIRPVLPGQAGREVLARLGPSRADAGARVTKTRARAPSR